MPLSSPGANAGAGWSMLRKLLPTKRQASIRTVGPCCGGTSATAARATANWLAAEPAHTAARLGVFTGHSFGRTAPRTPGQGGINAPGPHDAAHPATETCTLFVGRRGRDQVGADINLHTAMVIEGKGRRVAVHGVAQFDLGPPALIADGPRPSHRRARLSDRQHEAIGIVEVARSLLCAAASMKRPLATKWLYDLEPIAHGHPGAG